MELCLLRLEGVSPHRRGWGGLSYVWRGSHRTGVDGAVSTEAVLSHPQVHVAPEVRSRNALKKPLVVLNCLQTNKMAQRPLIPQGKRNPALKSVEKEITYQRPPRRT